MELFPIDVDYTVVDGKPLIRMFGLTSSGERKLLYDDSFRPYCYVEAEQAVLEEAITGLSFVDEIQSIKMTRLGNPISIYKVFTRLPEDVPKLRQLNLKTYDADIPFYKRYLLDNKMGSSSRVKLDVDGDRIKRIINAESGNPPLKSIAIDIETYSKRTFPDPKIDPIIAISLSNYDTKKCFTWLDASGEGVEKVDDERALLFKVAAFISDNGFNTIVGYNSDSFDLPYIKQRADILGIRPLFNNFEIKVKGERRRIADINGTIHIDILNFIRNIYAIYNLKTEVLTLREVAAEVIGDHKGEFDWNIVDNVFKDSAVASSLCEYCIQDSYITFKLYDRMYNLLGELNKLVGQTLGDISRMTTGAFVEHLIMRKVVELGEVIPNKPSDFEVNDRLKKINVGAFVFQPKPGLYADVAVVDFRSLYPSIIVSHNICPSTLKGTGSEVEFIDREERLGFIPNTLDEVLRLRADAKAKLKADSENKRLNARVTVLKLIANGFYGYLGYYNARWYCFDCAGRITALGRDYVHSVIKQAGEKGAEVIYADTDSAFIHKEGVSSFIEEFAAGVNKSLPHPMELEVQGVYTRALFVSGKTSGRGAKKKYALCDERGKLTIKGFQSVRRDWAIIAKEAQRNVLKKLLVDTDEKGAVDYVRDTIKNIKSGNVPLDKLVIFTRLHKAMSSYKQTGRHVSAASKSGLSFSSGDTIKYIITKGRPGESISSRSVLIDIAKRGGIKYDPDYYVNQQVIPSVIQILSVLGYKEEDLTGKVNNSLQSFFE